MSQKKKTNQKIQLGNLKSFNLISLSGCVDIDSKTIEVVDSVNENYTTATISVDIENKCAYGPSELSVLDSKTGKDLYLFLSPKQTELLCKILGYGNGKTKTANSVE